MVIGLALCSVAFNFVNIPSHEAATNNPVIKAAGRTGSMIWPMVILVAMIVYVAGYAIGMGNVPWQQSELFPLSVRSIGSGIATATNWGSNFLIGITFLPMMEGLTSVGTFALYTAICIVCWITVWRIYPETCGLSLEEVSKLLKDGWGVQESVRRAEERKRAAS